MFTKVNDAAKFLNELLKMSEHARRKLYLTSGREGVVLHISLSALLSRCSGSWFPLSDLDANTLARARAP